jgi:hypothetical protein
VAKVPQKPFAFGYVEEIEAPIDFGRMPDYAAFAAPPVEEDAGPWRSAAARVLDLID